MFVIRFQNNSSLRTTILNEWRWFCEKPPKGFEKYFKNGNGKQATKETKAEGKTAKEGSKDAKPVEKEKKLPPPPPPSSQPGGSKPYDNWSFGLFGGTGSR